MRAKRWLVVSLFAALLSLTAGGMPAYASSASGSDSTTISGTLTCHSGAPVEGVWVAALTSTPGWAAMDVPGGTSPTVSWTFTLDKGGTYTIHSGCAGSPDDWQILVYSGLITAASSSLTCYDDIAVFDRYGLCLS